MPEERKLVTILFADTTGSTALGEALDPEDVRALMARYYAHARRVIPAPWWHTGEVHRGCGDGRLRAAPRPWQRRRAGAGRGAGAA